MPPPFQTPSWGQREKHIIERCGVKLDAAITTPDEVDHSLCPSGIFARVLQDRVFLKSSDHELRILRRLPRSDSKQRHHNHLVYSTEYPWIIDTFCLFDYQLMPTDADPLSQFKTVSFQGKEKLPRPPLQLMIHALRFDISALSEMLRRDLCTFLHPDRVLDYPSKSLRQRFRVIRSVQNLYAEHSMMLAPQDDVFFFRACRVCTLYDPEIIRFSRDLYCILLRIFHGQSASPPSCRYFTSRPEMSDDDSV